MQTKGKGHLSVFCPLRRAPLLNVSLWVCLLRGTAFFVTCRKAGGKSKAGSNMQSRACEREVDVAQSAQNETVRWGHGSWLPSVVYFKQKSPSFSTHRWILGSAISPTRRLSASQPFLGSSRHCGQLLSLPTFRSGDAIMILNRCQRKAEIRDSRTDQRKLMNNGLGWRGWMDGLHRNKKPEDYREHRGSRYEPGY